MILMFNRNWSPPLPRRRWAVLCLCGAAGARVAAQPAPAAGNMTNAAAQTWNWHVQNTDIVQGYPGFASKYSGPNSLPSGGQTRESVSLDVFAGVRLWRGAEAH